MQSSPHPAFYQFGDKAELEELLRIIERRKPESAPRKGTDQSGGITPPLIDPIGWLQSH